MVQIALAVVGGLREDGDARARAPLDRRGKPDVVVVVVRSDHELDVLDADPAQAQSALDRVERLVAARAGIDDGERLSAEQPRVDRADVRKWDLDCLD